MRSSAVERPLDALVVALGAVQALLIALTVARILDPGWVTVDAIGAIAGLGMASAVLAWALWVPSRGRRMATSLNALAILAGLVYSGVWLSPFGGTFYTDDVFRVGLAVACDVLFAIWLIAAARRAGSATPLAGIYWVAMLLSVRAIGELLLFVPLLMPSSGGLGPNFVDILAAGLVLVGWILLAVWEIALGLWLLRANRTAPEGVQPPGAA